MMNYISIDFQVPDAKTGKDKVDAVVVDEESVGSVLASGSGAKILLGDGALDHYLSGIKSTDQLVLPFLSLLFLLLVIDILEWQPVLTFHIRET